MTTAVPIGLVLRASTVSFTVGCRVLQSSIPQFGDLVKVIPLADDAPDESRDTIYTLGLIYNVQVEDDPAVRQLILVDAIEPEVRQDQRENRLVPIEINILVVGYQQNRDFVQGLPPQPPISLDSLVVCDDADLRAFTRSETDLYRLDYLQLVLNAPHAPTDELLIANLRRTAAAYPPETRRPFLIGVGRELARLLSADLVRLDSILRRIRPIE